MWRERVQRISKWVLRALPCTAKTAKCCQLEGTLLAVRCTGSRMRANARTRIPASLKRDPRRTQTTANPYVSSTVSSLSLSQRWPGPETTATLGRVRARFPGPEGASPAAPSEFVLPRVRQSPCPLLKRRGSQLPLRLRQSERKRGRQGQRVPDGNPRERQKPSITRTGSFERRLWGRVAGLESCPDQGLTAL